MNVPIGRGARWIGAVIVVGALGVHLLGGSARGGAADGASGVLLPGLEAPTQTEQPPNPPSPPPACDPTAQLFVRMDAALAAMALELSGKSPDDLTAAIAKQRELTRRYFDALGLEIDDDRLDAIVGPGSLANADPATC